MGYTLVNPPSGASIDSNGIITWTPGQTQSPSTNTLKTVVTSTDPYDLVNPQLSATNSFTVVVLNGPLVVLNSTTLIAEGFFPTNNAIDPNETVTVLFALKNAGVANTTNLVVTLLPTNGVSAPSGPQTYGVLVAGGAAVSQPFTFTALGTCGGTINPTLQLQDGAANLGTVTVALTLGQPGTVFSQNFDSVTAPALPSGWTTTNTGVESAWVTRTNHQQHPTQCGLRAGRGQYRHQRFGVPRHRAAARPVTALVSEQLQSGSQQQRLLRRWRARNQDRGRLVYRHPHRRRHLSSAAVMWAPFRRFTATRSPTGWPGAAIR